MLCARVCMCLVDDSLSISYWHISWFFHWVGILQLQGCKAMGDVWWALVFNPCVCVCRCVPCNSDLEPSHCTCWRWDRQSQ